MNCPTQSIAHSKRLSALEYATEYTALGLEVLIIQVNSDDIGATLITRLFIGKSWQRRCDRDSHFEDRYVDENVHRWVDS